MKKINIINYYTHSINNNYIDTIYLDLLKHEGSFGLITCDDAYYALTKEKSIIVLDNPDEFVKQAQEDKYYKTTIVDKEWDINKKDLALFNYYIEKYKKDIYKETGGKYIFGSVAVRSNSGSFITTIRGKVNLNSYTTVYNVDHDQMIVKAFPYKATLNAPLLSKLFENSKVKAIVHLNHQYIAGKPTYVYAFPGTVKDSYRNNNTSFNIEHHGMILLYDKNGNQI